MAKKKSIVRQAVERLLSMAAWGHSKHADKRIHNGHGARDKIYAGKTMDIYIDVAARFVRWAKAEHGCRTVDEARPYVAAYLQFQIGQHKSAWTVRTVASGLAKLYGCGMGDFGVKLPERYRENVTQHRGNRWVGHYNAYKHRVLELFCRSCGLRRHEVAKIRPEDVYQDDEGRVIVHVVQGKGGKERYVVALDDTPLRIAEAAAGKEHIFDKIPKYAPIHEWRAAYAKTLYAGLARSVDDIPPKERYICRAERAGVTYDKKAMAVVSQMLGHARLDVVTNYLD